MALENFGIRLPNSGPFATAESIFKIADRAESLGFGSVWVHDHVSWKRDKLTHFAAGSVEACRDQDPNFFESLTTITAVGTRLRRAQVGVAGMILPLRDPRLLGKQLATIDHLIGPGRAIVAFGVGSIPNDFEVMGVPMERRGRLANEHIAALRAVLEGDEPVSFEGKWLKFANGAFYPKPRQVSLWVAGGSEAARRRAARYADGWLVSPNGFPHDDQFRIEEYAAAVRQFRDFVAEEGRPADATVALEVFISLAETDEAAVRIAARSLEDRFKTVKRGMQETIVGSSETFIERIDAFRAAGSQRFELKFICHDLGQMQAMMEQAAMAIARHEPKRAAASAAANV